MHFIRSTEEENKILAKVLDDITVKSEMSLLDKEFLNSLLLRLKPKKILELGVAAGASSVLILNAISDNSDARLYSVDTSRRWHLDESHECGFLVNEKYQHLADKWKMYPGDYAFSFMEEIGSGIDFCLIDTTHTTPGVILDFLMVLPFLKEHAVVVFHNSALNVALGDDGGYANLLLMSAISGVKLLPYNEPGKNLYYNFHNKHPEISNIGAVALEDDIMSERLFDLFNLLLMPWQSKVSREDVNRVSAFFKKYYAQQYIDLYDKAVSYNLRMIER